MAKFTAEQKKELMNKVCKKCSSDLPLENFYKNKECSLGRENICKVCRNTQTLATRDKETHNKQAAKYRNKNREALNITAKQDYQKNKKVVKNRFYLNKYNISLEEAQLLLEKQEHKCKICSTPLTLDIKKENTGHVDHCHTTLAVRGILCAHCNTGLGLFKDNVNNLTAAIRYLNENNG